MHGFIELRDEEWDLVDTPVFQRLRGIRQLALASLVYPGATHTRFEHSLGVTHVAGRMAERLDLDPDDRKLIRHAALLHDVGHGPFSHISEQALDLLAVSDSEFSTESQPVHETISWKIIETDPSINYLLSQSSVEDLIAVLSGCSKSTILTQIISGAADADKQDYLLRDSLACGVKYGSYDIERLHNTMISLDDEHDKDKYIAFNQGGVQALEQFVLAKYYMNTQVYRHKVRRISDAMILRAVLLGSMIDRVQFLRDVFVYQDDIEYLNNYKLCDDIRVIAEARDPCRSNTWFARLFNMLLERRLLKEVFAARVGDLPVSVRQVLLEGLQPEVKKRIEESIATLLRCDPELVILDEYSMGWAPSTSESEIQISDGGRIQAFLERSSIFSNVKEALQERWLAVYAPRESVESAAQRRQATQLSEDIGCVIAEQIVTGEGGDG